MAQSVVFSTPGLIPIEAFTMFGVNAKPNSTNPFGFFGTGLKIAIAVCVRMGQEVVIWRGKDKYTFYVKETEFRNKGFGYVRMKRETWKLNDVWGGKSYISLPFTTELGKTWELWQAFREFETNTRDEGGTTSMNPVWVEHEPPGHAGSYQDTFQIGTDQSHIVVTGSKFVDEYHDRGRNFLAGGLTQRSESSGGIQVLDKPSNHVYYRGVRVMDLKEEAQFTYNFLKSVDLTEDRTAKYPFLLENDICNLIMESEDEDFLGRTVGKQSSGFERTLPYSYTSSRPTSTFVTVAKDSPNVRAKEKAVEASAPITPVTRILVTIPKADISDEEFQDFEDALERIFGDIVMAEKQS